jgi:nucleoside-diphosphate-sugar epimerase
MAIKVLVTGANGWLGIHLIAQLSTLGVAVVAIDRTDLNNALELHNACTFVQADLGNRDEIARVWKDHGPFDAVYHGAALHKPMIATHTRQDFIDSNITGMSHRDSLSCVAAPRLLFSLYRLPT